MSEQQIITMITGYLADAQAGLTKENPKLDFKSKWYNLKDHDDINEFLKDTSAIANTPGLDGFVVIGYDEKGQIFTDAYFTQCGLKDSNELVGLLIKRVDRAYDITCYDIEIDGHKMSILRIPPSFDKPHVIKSYQKKTTSVPVEHRVFIRNGTSTRVATKYDLDFIAYDRKNHAPEYALFLSTSKSSLHISLEPSQKILLHASIIVENIGLRPVAIKEIVLTFHYPNQTITYVSRDNREERYNTTIAVSNLIIHPFEIKSFTALVFISLEKLTPTEFSDFQANQNKVETIQALLKLNNDRLLQTNVEF